jgi:isoleucyl-tRNA synthetase
MPYAQAHYPFALEEGFNPEKDRGFPADFIAEGLDQTRGWFYTMLIFSAALFGRSSYKHVVTNGLVLAEDGQKMSKSLKNYPDPLLLVDRYGADALRFYLLASPVVRGEDLAFSERGVEEVYRKVIQRLTNVVSFYDLHRTPPATPSSRTSPHPLDRWILARLNQTISAVDQSLARYELDYAVRPLADFIDDLSNWYLRRSRQRLKGTDDADRVDALQMLVFVLQTLARLLAPFVPFIAEWVYQTIGGEKESVHLESWPSAAPADAVVLNNMLTVRKIVEMGLAARETHKIKIRQPLAELRLGEEWKLEAEFFPLLADELNVKNVSVAEGATLPADGGWQELTDPAGAGRSGAFLYMTLSPELVAEGQLRELVRALQDWRKKNNLTPREAVSLQLTTDSSGRALVEKFLAEIKRTVNLSAVTIVEGVGTEKVGEHFFNFERHA